MKFICHPVHGNKLDSDMEWEADCHTPQQAARDYLEAADVEATDGERLDILVLPGDDVAREAWAWERHFDRDALRYRMTARLQWEAAAVDP